MISDETWTTPVTARGRMLLSIFAACVEDRSQHDRTNWCMLAREQDDASLKNVPAIWSRAVAILRMTVAVRRAAEWN